MRRLGLDIGTNSIGWCLIEYDEVEDGKPIDKAIVDIGVRIFSDGRDPKSGASLAVDRRDARAMRRRRDRYLRRRSALLKALVAHGLMPADADEAKLIAERDPYPLRRVVKFSTNGTLTLAAANEAGPLKARDAAPTDLDPFEYVHRTGGSLKKLKARQVRVDLLGRVFDPGPPE